MGIYNLLSSITNPGDNILTCETTNLESFGIESRVYKYK